MTTANASQPTLPNSPAPLVRSWFSRMWNFNKLADAIGHDLCRVDPNLYCRRYS